MYDDTLSFRYRAFLHPRVAAHAERQINIHRQAYNYTKYQHETLPDDADNVGSAYKHHNRLPDWKQEYPVFGKVHSKALQKTVRRYYDSLSGLTELKQKGYNVGRLNWKGRGEYRSVTYSQSGFNVDENTGRDDRTTVWLSGIGTFSIRYHRDLPDGADIKEVILKKEKTERWFCTIVVDPPEHYGQEKPDLDDPGDVADLDVVGVDVGILTYAHDTSGNRFESLDLEEERRRLEREYRSLSRKQHGSKNWEKQRQRVAECHADIKNKRKDFVEKLSTWYVQTFDVVVVEDLDIPSMLQGPQNAREKASAAWGLFKRRLLDKQDLYGCHVVDVDPADTTKACANCGVKTDKELWVREHSCPSCGFRADRDLNAAYNILRRGLRELGVGHSEGTPVETALPVGTRVPAQRVVEPGSHVLKEAALAAE